MTTDDDRALRALDLATAGLSVAKIATMLDTTPKEVKALIKAGKKRDPRDYDPDVEARRLDKMSAALWPLASQGDPETVGVVVKLMERRDMMDATIDGDLAAAVRITAKLQKAHRDQVATRADTE
nr:MAG TPA: Protein of unknown function (DUF2802) [Caudoviricetes sp.]